MNCVDVCPVKDTLDLKNVVVRKTINKKWVAVGVVGIFMLITGIGIVTGYWQNNVSKEEYLFHHKNIDDLGHPTDSKSIKKMNEEVSK